MTKSKNILALGILILFIIGLITYISINTQEEERIVSYIVNTKKQDIEFYWKDDSLNLFKSILNLKTWLESKHKTLVFAMNGGMFKQDNTPLGLYIEEYKTLVNLDTSSGEGNFYLKPNGIFYMSKDGQCTICKSSEFTFTNTCKYALQSGPMLVIDGKIHHSFKKGSINLNIRNGVGLLPDNNVVFAMSKYPINFYDFAEYFKSLGCKNALYLDGYVSRTYLPEKNWKQTDGNFGVIVGVSKQH